MTNEQAIKILQTYFECRRKEDGGYCDGECHECELVQKAEDIEQAYNMAIMALETSCDNCPLDVENNYNSAENNHISETHEEVEIKSENNEPYFKNDLISRKAVLDMLNKIDKAVEEGEGYQHQEWVDYVEELPTIPKPKVEGDLISKKDLKDGIISWIKMAKYYHQNEEIEDMPISEIIDIIDTTETVELLTIPQTNTAEWIDNIYIVGETHELRHLYRCSKCERYFSEQTNFCPNCGSRMKGDTE